MKVKDITEGLALMVVDGCQFKYVTNLTPERQPDGAVKALMPQSRYKNTRCLPLNKYGAGPFCKFAIPNEYQTSGVYLFVAGSEVRYVGECMNLSNRFNAGYGNISPRNCFKGGQETNCRLNNLVYRAASEDETLSLFFHGTTDYKAIEARLRDKLRPPWNRA